ncbi:MAG: hypothetical protein Q8M15_04960 [Bacteroidota bacterium]|nr:hypothetical protein [Bacteroidota bacterium]
MTSLTLISVQLVFACFLAGIIYLSVRFLLKNFSGKSGTATNIKSSDNLHFAVIFNDFISEKHLIHQIQFLTNQGYPNFTAYFFIDTPYVAVNNLQNIRIIRPSQEQFSRYGVLNLCKKHFHINHKAVLVVEPSVNLGANYFHEMNDYLCKGYKNSNQLPLFYLLAKTKNPISYFNTFKAWLMSFITINRNQNLRHPSISKGGLDSCNNTSLTSY